MNGVLFVNDPECLIVGDTVADRGGWAAHVEATRGAVVSSDRLGGLDEWGLDRTRRLLAAAAAGWPEA
jgi:alpha-galactosidase